MAVAKIEEVGVQASGVQTDVTKAASVDHMVRTTSAMRLPFWPPTRQDTSVGSPCRSRVADSDQRVVGIVMNHYWVR